MKVYDNPDRSLWDKLVQRPAQEQRTLDETVRQILMDVRTHGDEALRRYALKFDHFSPPSLTLPLDLLQSAGQKLDPTLRAAIETAARNIRTFHESQRRSEPVVETTPGVTCWRKSVALERVGLYIPGGSAPLFSTVLMLGIPASIARCKAVHLCTPASRDGSVHPAILYAAQLCGIVHVHPVGGAQAIAALAFGTESIPRVDKIFGPGNQYVTRAKQMALEYGVAIDMPAGPSEALVVGDKSATPAFVAADLLSQAEHGPDSQVVLVSLDAALSKAVESAIAEQLSSLPRAETAKVSLAASMIVNFDDTDTAMDFVNYYAPEHLLLQTNDPSALASRVVHAGSVFLGHWTPEAAGDYASGTNHTLPTSRFARSFSGVSLDSFVRMITFQQITPDGLRRLGPTLETLATAEQLEGHRQAVHIRTRQQ